VRDVEVPSAEPAITALFGLVLAEAQHIHADRLKTRPGDFGADVMAILAQSAPTTPQLMAAFGEAYKLTTAFRQALESVDVMVTPTTPIPAVKIGQDMVRQGGVEEPSLFTLIRCTAPFNATHLPALSLPCGFSPEGLPFGMQIVGRPFDEATVLAAGHAYEQATDWHRRRPAL
jgi:Asp-tRNA(Asn)/Glu-tRNA(Gln) amidotransferase A subunit family amidase